MGSTTRDWVDFFQKAGIPPDESATYAIIFTKNRIQKNMLNDLKKEYLQDMGITLLGDIIAILKHAQITHEASTRDLMLKESSSKALGKIDLTDKSASPSAANETVKRLLDHYTRKYKEGKDIVSATSPNDSVNTKKSNKMHHMKAVPTGDKPYQVTEKKKPNLQHTAKSNKFSEIKVTEKKTVFDRLGDGTVSSTTSEVVSKTAILPAAKASSVFSRLGEVSSTSLEEKLILKADALPYAGVLKQAKTSSRISQFSDSQREANHEQGLQSNNTKLQMNASGPVKRNMSPSRSDTQLSDSKPNFLKTRELKMLKITTEFADEDESGPSKKLTERFQSISSDISQRKRKSIDDVDMSCASPKPPVKKVRFGAITEALIPSSDYERRSKPSKLLRNFSNLKITTERNNQASRYGGIKARVGNKKPLLATSKLVSDSMIRNNTLKRGPVKSRLSLKSKPKLSITDRLG